ncbi:MAG TPA: endo-1,4-beta-xylanase, partial [Pirellulales bacterium]|nr:endo-1,4-beta-xylanase [Pirellulales bacterium]
MGLMRFLVPRRILAAGALERAFFSGMDDLPWQGRSQWQDDQIFVKRVENDSGQYHIPWPIEGYGELLLGTATLMERDAPYRLSVELARGTIHRLRQHLATWQGWGLTVSDRVLTPLAAARKEFARAVTQQKEPAVADQFAAAAIERAVAAGDRLAQEFVEAALTARRQQAARNSALFGASLGSTAVDPAAGAWLPEVFNTAIVPLSWREVEQHEGVRDWSVADRQIEWCREHGMRVCGGPLVQLDRTSVPDWLYLWEGDDEAVVKFAADYVREAVNRYRGKVHLWQSAARLNVNDVLSLSEEQRLRLVVIAIEAVRQTDPKVPVTLVVDQPFAEFMAERECDLSPLHFADALVRAEIGLVAIGLEINLGYWPGGTGLRDVLELGRQIDRWSMLGMPLLLTLTMPSAAGADPLARSAAQPVPFGAKGELTVELQRQWIERLLPMLLTKPAVQGIFWNQLADNVAHDFPHGGLIDAAGKPKPAVEAL